MSKDHYHDAQDTRHTYDHSPHGILVRSRTGLWAGFYKYRPHQGNDTPPTRLVLTGYKFGDCPGELAVGFYTTGDIINNILTDQLMAL